MKVLILLFLILGLTLFSCGKEKKKKSSESFQDVSSIFSSDKINIKVFYEPGAEPYTEGIRQNSLWNNVFLPNMEAIFEGRKNPPAISVPNSLDQMSKLSPSKKSKWTVEDVENLNQSVASKDPKGTTTFNIFFVNGNSSEGDGVLGFHISGSRVMVIFKDVIEGMSNGALLVPRYVEQATLIHEMGHALGLVDNGLPMQSNHRDAEHGHHCNNPDCVMYWTNEGQSDMISFIKKYMSSKNPVMFDNKCLEDSREY